MLRKRWLLTAVIVATACAVTGAEAARRAGGLRRAAPPLKAQRASGIQTLDSDRRIDVNSANMWVTNYGSFAFDLSTGNSGLVWPKGTTKTAVFASGLWLGALVDGERRMAIAEYGMEFGPGRILTPTTFDTPSDPRLIAYKVVRFSGNPQDTAHVERSAEEITADGLADPLVHHSWSEYVNGAKPFGAPTRTYRFPNTATASDTDSVTVEGPDVLGDQMIWTIYNDLDPENHQGNTDAGSTEPMGVEIEQKTFGFNRLGPLGNTVFLSFKIRNKGGNPLDDLYVSLWSDPDLGGFTDDLVGVDTTRSLGFCYNASNNDQIYGLQPPAVGYDFFKGPEVAGDTLGLASFNKYINGTDPHSPLETYNYMRGLQPDGSILIDPTTGLPTRFFHPGDPVTRTGWLDAVPADRRFLLTTGPFSMAPGDSQTIVAAIVIAQGVDRTSSISLLRCFDDIAQLAFDRGFQLPAPPTPPQVVASVDQNQVTLTWDTSSRLGPQAPGYTFEGYNVYQGETVAGPWHRVVTFDEANRIGQVLELQCSSSGSQLEVPTAFGSDAGISYSFTTGDDVVRGGRLKEGTDYYFAVTAYSLDTTQVFPNSQVLENSPSAQVIRVIPQSAAAGTDYSTASATPVTYAPADTTQIPTTVNVTIEVTNPFNVTGHDYRVDFYPVDTLYTRFVAGDTATARVFWRLTDVTTSQVRLDRQLNLRGDSDYEVVDGLLVKVAGSFFPELTSVRYQDLNEDGLRLLEAALNWSGNPDLFFFGGGGFASLFRDDETTFASSVGEGTPPDSFRRVVLAFDTAPNHKSYRFLRYEIGDTSTQVGNAPPGGRQWAYGGYADSRLIAADELTGEQLQTAFVERIFTDSLGVVLPDSMQPATRDTTWFPNDDRSTLGGREYVWVLNRLYAEGEIPAIAQDGEPVDTGSPWPALYALTAKERAVPSDINPHDWQGDGIRYAWEIPPSPNDAFTFSTSSLVQNDAAIAKAALSRIRVVPNPYYTRSRYEQSQFNRVIRFINMPERATVRIYNLAGELVRTLRKDDAGGSVLTWDVLTENQLPVASGIYVYHVEAPGVGETFGRLVVFMEKERLNNL